MLPVPVEGPGPGTKKAEGVLDEQADGIVAAFAAIGGRDRGLLVGGSGLTGKTWQADRNHDQGPGVPGCSPGGPAGEVHHRVQVGRDLRGQGRLQPGRRDLHDDLVRRHDDRPWAVDDGGLPRGLDGHRVRCRAVDGHELRVANSELTITLTDHGTLQYK